MIFRESELQGLIGCTDVVTYLKGKGYNYMSVGSKDKVHYLIENKLNLKPRVVIEDVLRKEYGVDDKLLDRLINVVVGVYKSDKLVNIKDLVSSDRVITDTLIKNEMIMYDYHNANIQIKYSLLAKIVEV